MQKTMEWGLIYAYQRNKNSDDVQSQSNAKSGLKLIKPLTTEERELLIGDGDLIRKSASSFNIINAIQVNKFEFSKTIDNILCFASKNLTNFEDIRATEFSMIERTLFNLCVSFNAFMDYQDVLISKKFGRNSAETLDWIKFKDDLQKTNNYYALFFNLRNYIVHFSLPPLILNINSDLKESISVSLYLSKNKLLTSGAKWYPTVRRFIESFDENISIFILIEKWEQAFLKIQDYHRDLNLKPCLTSVDRLLKIREQHGLDNTGKLGLSPIPKKTKSGKLTFEIQWLEEDKARLIRGAFESRKSDKKANN